ncbi:DUF4169 family protein [Sulfitobacter sp. M57]|uniref:DUF4169 family protein n=1 Tax=unclassified Sulfitobacter TaxID=196795 RepID=UPI0023E2F1E9|nr:MULTISPECIES: DUF4169 family protein [unclassified Sulfitobacter]MDF3413596.1 DUF4169 family protein [Sulfitobacter sp. KE5]MDF3421122.1 DUF4169 family protein [Sulfitobacter sp. KE43]MDF3432142.1 DUF4169 family protein [Sulfitobacter sp. KE42]MDF3457782.1 DUF4169 family protein [Sulfitobacter sp. S74]MDF3461683.1 DUF4169 family protein [Sulfitobacter sp. Ks18]
MTSPINLNKVRKERDRASRKTRANENAVRFGQSKAEKEGVRTRAEKETRALDGHKRET